jgi:TPR repeat protein
LTLGKLYR